MTSRHITKGSVLKANLVSQYDSLGATSVTWNMFAISTVYNKKWLLIAKTFHDVLLLTPDFVSLHRKLSVMLNTGREAGRKIRSQIINLPPNTHHMCQLWGDFDLGFEDLKTPHPHQNPPTPWNWNFSWNILTLIWPLQNTPAPFRTDQNWNFSWRT